MIIDLITIGMLLAFVFWGTKRGAIKMIFSAVSYGASIIVGIVVYRPIAGMLHAMGITQGLAHKLAENGAMEFIPGVMKDMPFVADGIEEMAMSVASAAVSAVSFLAAVLIARLVLFVVSSVMGFAGSMPLIRQANGLMGGIAGLAVGVLVELLAFGALAMLEVFGKSGITAQLMEGSNIAAMIYNNNPLLSSIVSMAL